MKKDISNYVLWCNDTWRIKNEKDTLIVSLAGFAGEAGEISEEILNQNDDDLLKEFGDFIYYWVRINLYYKNDINIVEYTIKENNDLLLLTLEFHKYVGKVCETIKKNIANNADINNLGSYMSECLNVVMSLAKNKGYDMDDIVLANMKKIENRMRNGTLLGNGNNR